MVGVSDILLSDALAVCICKIRTLHFIDFVIGILEAHQRYFSYCAILVAIVLQNYLVFVFMGYRTTIARHVAKWSIAQMRLCTTVPRGVSHYFGELLTSLKKYRAIWGIAAIVSQYRAIGGP